MIPQSLPDVQNSLTEMDNFQKWNHHLSHLKFKEPLYSPANSSQSVNLQLPFPLQSESLKHVTGKLETYKVAPGELYVVFKLSEDQIKTQSQPDKNKDNSSILTSKDTQFPHEIK